jgi:thiol-disulfide isomerase/thioredoxin
MPITFPCPECQSSLRRPDDLPAGKTIRCPRCGARFAVPAEEGVATSAVKSANLPPEAQPPTVAIEKPRRARPDPADETEPIDDRPARRRAAARRDSGGAGVLIAVAAVAALVFLGMAGVVVYAFVLRAKPQPAQPPVVVGPPPILPGGGMPVPPAGGPPGGDGVINPPVGGPAVPGFIPIGPQPQVGEEAPEIDGKDVEGKPLKLSEHRGKVVVIDFWGHWCVFCRQTYPYQRQLAQRSEGKPLVVLGVNSDETPEQVRLVMKNHNINWRSWYDGPNMTGPIYRRWAIEGIPTTYILDHKGVVRYQYVGVTDGAVMDKAIDGLLAELEKDKPTTTP